MPEDDRSLRNQGDERPIVVGIDGSEHSRFAMKWAADEAKRRDGVLRIIHARRGESENLPVWYEQSSSDLSPGEAIVEDAVGLVATRHPSVMARSEILERPPALALIGASRSTELLVVGARGEGGSKGPLLGSVSDQCVQYAHCPVAVIHSDVDDLPYRAVQPRIVVGIDGSLGSTRALRWALEEAPIHSASVDAVFAWQYRSIGAIGKGPTEPYVVVAHEMVDAATEYAVQRAPEVSFKATARFEAAASALLDASRGADLLVVGSRGHGSHHDALLGSIAHECSRHASCAVVVVRPQIAEDDSEVAPAVDWGAVRLKGRVQPVVPTSATKPIRLTHWALGAPLWRGKAHEYGWRSWTPIGGASARIGIVL